MNLPIRTAGALAIGSVVAAVLATTYLVVAVAPNVLAETAPPASKPTSAKPTAQKKPQKPPTTTQQQTPPETQQVQAPVFVPPLIYRPWMKTCPAVDANQNPNAGNKQHCYIFMRGYDQETGNLVMAATLEEVQGEPRKVLHVSFTYGVSLPIGTHIVLDDSKVHQGTAPYGFCLPPNIPPPIFACVSQYDLSADMIAAMKKGKFLVVQTLVSGQTYSPQLPLADFAKAYDGPPTDLKAEAEQNKKLQDALRERAIKKQEELSKKQ
ncbi:MAG TPA: invasion associated locus B family protein [Xanthobacteraceae bacterium]|nr:invasion associated locus B family protein [Xanthobacteraceae bacterium]